MPLAYRRTPALGLQWIPPFSKKVTLHQVVQCWDDMEQSGGFPAADSIYNIACLAFLQRGASSSFQTAGRYQALGRSYWSTNIADGVNNIYGVSEVAIPQGAELVAISWLKPPDWTFAQGALGPYPEDLFRLVYTLAL